MPFKPTLVSGRRREDARRVKVGNVLVSGVLRSPAHRLLSGSTGLIRYTGRRSGRTITTPTQYTRSGDDLLILVGHPEAKAWWRNFLGDRDIDVLVRGQWLAMTARVVRGADEPDELLPLLDEYLKRFPRAKASLGNGTLQDMVKRTVIVRCRLR
jgi:deazaflavin-dependent oxidoreductase (nitroreductase family)